MRHDMQRAFVNLVKLSVWMLLKTKLRNRIFDVIDFWAELRNMTRVGCVLPKSDPCSLQVAQQQSTTDPLADPPSRKVSPSVSGGAAVQPLIALADPPRVRDPLQFQVAQQRIPLAKLEKFNWRKEHEIKQFLQLLGEEKHQNFRIKISKKHRFLLRL